jgi:hypothetical protein
MRDSKALGLFQEILKQTRAKSLGWQATAEPDKFVAPMLGKYTMTLLPYTYQDSWGEHKGAPSLILQDQHNNTIVEIDSSLEGVTSQDLQELLVSARRVALNVDEKIDELLQELQKGDKGLPF